VRGDGRACCDARGTSDLWNSGHDMCYKHIMEVVAGRNGWADPGVPATAEVERFCVQHDLMEHLSAALRLVSECFDLVKELSVRLQHDPDVGDEWVVIDAAVRGERQEVRTSYHRYLQAFVAAVPAAQREKVRLFYERV